MTQSKDKIDQIEAELNELRQRQENTQQQLDNQVAVNAELRTSTTELRKTIEALLQIATLHQENVNQLTNKVNADSVELQSQFNQVVAEAKMDRQAWLVDLRRIREYLAGEEVL